MIKQLLCEQNTIQIHKSNIIQVLPKYDEKQDEKGSDPLSWGDVASWELFPVAPGREHAIMNLVNDYDVAELIFVGTVGTGSTGILLLFLLV